MGIPALLKIKIFWNKGYYVIYYVYDVTRKILLHDSNYIMDVVMWPKLDKSSICITEVIITSILKGFDQKKHFFWGWSSFRFNNLGLALGTNLHQPVKRAKMKSQKVLRANSYVCRGYRGKTGRGGLFTSPPPSWIGCFINSTEYYKTEVQW